MVAGGVAMAAEGGPDAFGYTWTDEVPYSWFDAAGGTELFLADEMLAGPFDIGFPFDFYGQTFSRIYVGSNGRLVFVKQPESFNIPCIPSAEPYVGYAALYWDDLNPHEGGHVYQQTLGEEPERFFVVEYEAVPLWRNPAETVTAEIVLSEQTGDVYLQYQNPSAEAGLNAVVGLMDPDGSTGLSVLCHQAVLTPETAILLRHPPFVDLRVADAAVAARPGDEAVYALTVRNVTGEETAFDVTWQLNQWNMAASPSALTLAPGDSGTVELRVTVPALTPNWDTDEALVTVRSSTSPDIAAQARLVTTAGPDWTVYDGLLPEPFQHTAIVTDGDWLYAVSNYLAPGMAGTMVRFNLEGESQPLPDLAPVGNVTDGVYLWNKLVFPGGVSADGEVSATMYVFDLSALAWLDGYALPSPRAFAAAVVLHEKLYVLGGFDGQQALDEVWVVYPGSATWHRVASMLARRQRPAAGAVGDAIVVVGGVAGGVYSAERYDPETDAWSVITPPPEELEGGADCTCNGRFFVIGGEADNVAGDQVLQYDPATDAWTAISSLQTARWGTEADLLAGRVVIAGGMHDPFAPLDSAESLDLSCADELVHRDIDFGTRPDLDDPDDDDSPPTPAGDDDDDNEACCGC
jgi:hypothetical protein